MLDLNSQQVGGADIVQRLNHSIQLDRGIHMKVQDVLDLPTFPASLLRRRVLVKLHFDHLGGKLGRGIVRDQGTQVGSRWLGEIWSGELCSPKERVEDGWVVLS